MSVLSISWRRLRKRWLRRGVDRRHALRRWLIDYVVDHGFEIGDFSFGSPEVRYYHDGSRLIVGKFCSIAESSTFLLGGAHRTDFASTFPFGEMTRVKGPSDRPRSRGDIVVGHDVWVAANATVLSGVTIGHGAAVGAGSVVIEDVPPYAVMFGNPARLVSRRFSDEIVAELLELRWWDLDEQQIRTLRPQLESTDIEAFIAACRAIRGLPPRTPQAVPPVTVKEPAPAPPPLAPAPGVAEQVVALVRKELPDFTEADIDKTFDRLGLDSFGMLMVRTHIEDEFNVAVDDARWSDVATSADIVDIVAGRQPRAASAAGPIDAPPPATAPRAPLWAPSPERASGSQLTAFMAAVNARHGLALASYRDLHRWSVENSGPFWQLVWERCGVIGEMGAARGRGRRPDAGRAVLSRRPSELRGEPASPRTTRRRDRVPRRGQGASGG